MDKEYKITRVELRDQWTSKDWGTFQGYALQLEGVDGWVSMSQKPETAPPVVDGTLFGNLIAETKGDKTYLKFKKAQSAFKSNQAVVGGKEEYIVEMLEELTGRRKAPDVVPTDIDDEISLADIPF